MTHPRARKRPRSLRKAFRPYRDFYTKRKKDHKYGAMGGLIGAAGGIGVAIITKNPNPIIIGATMGGNLGYYYSAFHRKRRKYR